MSYYVNWFLDKNEMDEMVGNFITQKQTFSNQAALNHYSKIILNKFKNSEEMDSYLNLVRQLVGNKNFEGALNQAVEALPMPTIGSRQLYIGAIQQEILADAKKFEQLQNEVTASLEAIISTLGVSDFPLIDKDLNSEALVALKQIYGNNEKIYNQMITGKQYQELDARFRGQYRYLLNLLPDFASCLSGSPSQTSLNIIQKLLGPIQRLIGICAEYQVEYEVQKILKELEKSLNSKNIKVQRVGDDKAEAKGFSTQTADLSISLGDNGKINFNIPNLGMTLKRTRKKINKNNTLNIKLKTGTNYGMLIKDIDSNVVNAFYNLYVNTRPIVNGIQQSSIPGGTLTAMYNHMKSLMGVTALIGDANAEDLVFVLVINEKAYTIFDLLSKMSEANLDKAFQIKPAFTTARKGLLEKHKELYSKYTPEERELRSSGIINSINKTSASVYMNINGKYL